MMIAHKVHRRLGLSAVQHAVAAAMAWKPHLGSIRGSRECLSMNQPLRRRLAAADTATTRSSGDHQCTRPRSVFVTTNRLLDGTGTGTPDNRSRPSDAFDAPNRESLHPRYRNGGSRDQNSADRYARSVSRPPTPAGPRAESDGKRQSPRTVELRQDCEACPILCRPLESVARVSAELPRSATCPLRSARDADLRRFLHNRARNRLKRLQISSKAYSTGSVVDSACLSTTTAKALTPQ